MNIIFSEKTLTRKEVLQEVYQDLNEVVERDLRWVPVTERLTRVMSHTNDKIRESVWDAHRERLSDEALEQLFKRTSDNIDEGVNETTKDIYINRLISILERSAAKLRRVL